MFAGDAAASSAMSDLLADNLGLLKGLTLTTFSQGSLDFQRKFQAAAPNVPYDGVAAQAYDAMAALLKAWEDTDPPREGKSLAERIPKQNFTGTYVYTVRLPVGWCLSLCWGVHALHAAAALSKASSNYSHTAMSALQELFAGVRVLCVVCSLQALCAHAPCPPPSFHSPPLSLRPPSFPSAPTFPALASTGVSGPIAFDTKGDLLPHDNTYIMATFDPKSGRLKPGPAIRLQQG